MTSAPTLRRLCAGSGSTSWQTERGMLSERESNEISRLAMHSRSQSLLLTATMKINIKIQNWTKTFIPINKTRDDFEN